MKALVLATGAGMAEVLKRNLRWLAAQGIEEVAIVVANAEPTLREECEQTGLRMTWLEEPTPLGSAGALRLLRTSFEAEPFFVVDASIEHDFSLRRLRLAHDASPAVATVAVELNGDGRSGRVWFERERSGRILRVLAKPDPQSRWGDAGVFLLDPSLLAQLPDRVPAEIARDLLPLVVQRHGILLGHAVEQRELPGLLATNGARGDREDSASG